MSDIRTAKASMAYRQAHQRPSCHNCASCTESKPHKGEQVTLNCKKGGFFTTAWSVCSQHTPKVAAAAPAAAD